MGGLKRKATTSSKNLKPKKRKVTGKEVKTEHNKDVLKTLFCKARTDDGDGRNEACKDWNEPTIDLYERAKVIDTDNTKLISNSTMTCSQIPDFTDEDINELINYSDLSLFLDDNSALDHAVDDSSLIFGGVSSSTELTTRTNPISSTSNKSETISSKVLDGPLDLSNKNNQLQDSNLVSSKYRLSRSFPTRIVGNANMAHRLYKNPYAVSTTTNCKCSWMIDQERSVTTNRNGLLSIEPTLKKKVRFPRIHDEDNRLPNNERRVQELHVSKVHFLEEILGLQKLQPEYDFQRLPGSTMIQCRVGFNNQYGYGTGHSTEKAKNCAASSFLEKLVNDGFFGNAIGRLQEFCMARNIEWPMYADVYQVRVPERNEFIFIKSCTVRQCKEFGQGRSKKMAKLFAALKVLSKLHEFK